MLNTRSSRILIELIRLHIQTGEPVGSRTLAKTGGFELSAATLRNVMADLEEMGYLLQPHTSAGRIPSDEGYRFYVDTVCQAETDEDLDNDRLSLALMENSGEIKKMMQDTSRLLSQLSRQMGLVLGPDQGRVLFHQMEFILLAPKKILVVMISPSGVVDNRIIDVEEDHRQEDLDRISRFLTERYTGWSLAEVRDDVLRQKKEAESRMDQLMTSALDLGEYYFTGVSETSELFLDGASNILCAPEFATGSSIQNLIKAIEEKTKLVNLLNSCLERNEGVSIIIGSESQVDDFNPCSIIASRFSYEGRVIGSVGILGPKRMPYKRLINLVERIAGQFSALMDHNRSKGN